MSEDNKFLITKAATTATDHLTSGGGKIADSQFPKVVSDMFDMTSMPADVVDIHKFASGAHELHFREQADRVLTFGTENTAPVRNTTPAYRKVTITPKEFEGSMYLTTQYRELALDPVDAVNGALKDLLVASGNNLEHLALYGNKSGAIGNHDIYDGGTSGKIFVDPFLSKCDGLVVTARRDSARVDAAGAPLTRDVFFDAKQRLPLKYRSDTSKLLFLVSPSHYDSWALNEATFLNGLSDRGQINGGSMRPMQIEMRSCPLLEHNPTEVVAATFTDGGTFQLPANNIVAGSINIMTEANAVLSEGDQLNSYDDYVITTDYTVDTATGIVTHVSAGSIPAATALRISWRAHPPIILTLKNNLAIGIGRDMTLEMYKNTPLNRLDWFFRGKTDIAVKRPLGIVIVDNVRTGA